jgi:hypothetical protein
MKAIVAGGVAAAACACAVLIAAQVGAQSGEGSRNTSKPNAPRAAARPKSVCPQEDMDDFHKCALEKMKSFTPPMTSYGKPDLTGMWRAQVRGQDIQAVDEAESKLYGGWAVMESIIVDPPDGVIPYQPWAQAQRPKNIEHFLSQGAACLPTPVQRWIYSPVTVTGHRVFQRPNQIVFSMERLHTFRIVPLDGRPHLPPNIRLWRGDTRGRWEGNTLVMETTNLNDFGWWDHQGSMASEDMTMVERITYVDADTMHYQATFADPKLFTRPWTMVQAMRRLYATGMDFVELEDTTVENCDEELGHMLSVGQRVFPGPKSLAPK